jgi:outer membrane protein assembly factor BamB
MKNANRSSIVMVGCVILISAGCVLAQDWPQWRGPNRDGKVSGFTAPQKWPKELTQKWRVTVGQGDATPALVGDRLYVFTRQGEEEFTLCLNAGTGEEIWRDKYAAQAVTGAPAPRHPGTRSSPIVANGKVVTMGVGGVLSCIDAAAGKVVWRKDPFPKVVPQFFTGMSPIITDGMCIAHFGGKDNGAIIAYDLATGDEKWKWAGDGPAYSSPVTMTVEGVKQVVVLTEKNLVGIGAADGKLLWQVATPPQKMSQNAPTPIVDGQTVIITGQGTGTKAVKVEKQGDGFVAKDVWSNADIGTQFNTPVLKDGLLFGLSNRGNLYCLDTTKNGQTVWTDTNSHGNFGAILDAGSCLLVLPEKSGLIVFKPDSKEYAQIAQYKVSDTPTYAHPVISGNRVFIKDKETVTMFTVE